MSSTFGHPGQVDSRPTSDPRRNMGWKLMMIGLSQVGGKGDVEDDYLSFVLENGGIL